MKNEDYHYLKKLFTKFQNKNKQRVEIIKQQLLPWFKYHPSYYEDKTNRTKVIEKELNQARSILLRWWRILLNQLHQVNYTERSLYFESIVEIISRSEFIDYDQKGRLTFDEWYGSFKNKIMEKRSQLEDYRYLLMSTLKYAIEKLNHKAIYSNMISFCSKILALCLIKIPDLITSLLHILPINNKILKRLNNEMGDLSNQDYYKSKLYQVFPEHLQPWMTSNHFQYKQNIYKLKSLSKHPIEMKGNWIRRWQSDDSELFFSFYRHYHVTLKTYITNAFPSMNKLNLQQRNLILSISPGYLFLASYFSGKIEALLHFKLNSVTTTTPTNTKNNNENNNSSSNQQQPNIMDSNESIISICVNNNNYNKNQQSQKVQNNNNNASSSGKPNILEVATRRYSDCLVWCVVISESNGLFHDMVNIWLRTMIKSTNMMNIESVYCLLDFIETVILDIQKIKKKMYMKLNSSTTKKKMKKEEFSTLSKQQQQQQQKSKWIPKIEKSLPPIDIPFILHTLYLILSKSDHTILLLRALSFIYTHFDYLTSHTSLLDYLGHGILLHPLIFERLSLHWGKNIRLFFTRCLIWKLSRVGSFNPNNKKDNWMMLINWKSFSSSFTITLCHDDDKDDTKKKEEKGEMVTSSTLCDGTCCQDILVQKNKLLSLDEWNQDPITTNVSYNRCALEIHISLENKLHWLKSRYLELNEQYVNQKSMTMRKGLPILQLLNDHFNHCNKNEEMDDESHFQSHIEPINYSLRHLKETEIEEEDQDDEDEEEEKGDDDHKEKEPSRNNHSSIPATNLLFKKTKLFNRALLNNSSSSLLATATTTKEKWFKLLPFHSNTTTTLSKKNVKINHHSQKEEEKKDSIAGDDAIYDLYYYTIPSIYTSLYLSTTTTSTSTTSATTKNSSIIKEDDSSPQQQNIPIIIIHQDQSSNLNINLEEQNEEQVSVERNKNDTIKRQDSSLYIDDDLDGLDEGGDDDLDEEEYQSNTTSPISMTTSISNDSILKKEEEVKDNDNNNKNEKKIIMNHHRLKKLTQPWYYLTENHIYATQFILELPSLLDEYYTWEEESSSHQNDCMPSLALEWPKNWSYSQ
ncbi:unnamed protein product [Cunninghamella blakesleeana]